jgi:hypothetical protein
MLPIQLFIFRKDRYGLPVIEETLMRYLAILFLLPAFFFFGCSASEASWLIDIERLSSSGHGEFSCIECHDDITDGKPHPDPAAVNKTLEDFFSIERCMECHDEV